MSPTVRHLAMENAMSSSDHSDLYPRLETTTEDGTTFTATYWPDATTKLGGFEYPAHVEASVRLAVAKMDDVSRISSGNALSPSRSALLSVMEICHGIISKSPSAQDVIPDLIALKVACERVQTSLLVLARRPEAKQPANSQSTFRPRKNETVEQARERRRLERKEAAQSSSGEGN